MLRASALVIPARSQGFPSGVSMRLVLAMLVMLASPAAAAPDSILWRSEGVEVTLYKTPCVTKEVLAQVHPSNHKLFQAGEATFLGEFGKPSVRILGCWALHPDDKGEVQVFFIDEIGQFGVLGRDKFVR